MDSENDIQNDDTSLQENDFPDEMESIYDRAMELRPIDNLCGSVFFRDKECVQLLLQEITQKRDLVIKHTATQDELGNIFGRGVRLDSMAFDEDGTIFNLEFQTSKRGAELDRGLYNYASIAQMYVPKSSNFKDFPNIKVVFVLEKDFFKFGTPVVTAEVKLSSPGEGMDASKFKIYYVNANYQENTRFGRMMHDICCSRSEDMYFATFAKRMDEVKNPKGREFGDMCDKIEAWRKADREAGRREGLREGLEQGRGEGAYDNMIKVAYNLFRENGSLSLAKKIVDLPEDQLKEIRAEVKDQMRAEQIRAEANAHAKIPSF